MFQGFGGGVHRCTHACRMPSGISTEETAHIASGSHLQPQAGRAALDLAFLEMQIRLDNSVFSSSLDETILRQPLAAIH